MAKDERPREDLMRDAVAYLQRAEFAVERGEPVFFGLHKTGGASIYFGEDPVYHFNSSRQLRRAFYQGELYKAEQGRLVRMKRDRSEGQSALVSRPLSEGEQFEFLATARLHFHQFAMAANHAGVEADRRVPEEFPAAKTVYDYFMGLSDPFEVADSPHAR